MKIKVTMKDPDTMYDAVNEAVEKEVAALELPDDEAEQIRETRAEKIREKLAHWFKYSEYLTTEFDTDAMTATVMPAE